MSGVVAYLHNSDGNIVGTTTTNNGGHYTFHDVNPGVYTITFTTDQPAGGINLSDAYLVLMKVLIPSFYLTPIQLLASDVDGSGTITLNDYALILTGYLNQGNPFPIGPWVFEPFPPITIPNAAREGFTTRGGSSGDVNGSLVPDPKNSSICLSNPVINITTGLTDPIEFKLTSAGNLNIAGMHLVIQIPEGLSVLNVESPINSASISLINNQVRVTWIDEAMEGFEIVDGMPILVITTKATSLTRNANIYSLRLGNESHFINTSGEMISGINLMLPSISVSAEKELAVAVYPNPFRENLNLNFLLPEDGNAIISIFDQSGRTVRKITEGIGSAGNHEVEIDGTDLIPGIYHYSITYNGNSQLISTGTIIKSK